MNINTKINILAVNARRITIMSVIFNEGGETSHPKLSSELAQPSCLKFLAFILTLSEALKLHVQMPIQPEGRKPAKACHV